MAFSVNARNKDSIEKIHLLSNVSQDDVKRVFQVLAFNITTDYMEGDWTNIPFIGDIKVVSNEQDSTVDIAFDPEKKFVRNIHQVIDGKVSESEETTMNSIQAMLNKHFS